MWRADVHAPTSRFLTGTQQNGGATAANYAPITKKKKISILRIIGITTMIPLSLIQPLPRGGP